MLPALLHFSVATHFCSGNQVASIVSLTGKLATCGMEDNDHDLPATGIIIKSHCCDNIVTFFGITNSYFPSFSFVPESLQHTIQIFSIPASQSFSLAESNKSTYTSVSPPGPSVSNCVDIKAICVFRI